uniref:Sosondowah ankyrin repeat domain family member C n=1 Tax=Gasterosteus aculeatus aculeatus TaxID=481459 RepID=A0AAQ4R7Q3_GASAC
MAAPCTEQAVQEFLMERGGRVQQMELIDHFLSVSGKADRTNAAADREALKGVVDNVGFVEEENGVEFVCLIAEGPPCGVPRPAGARGAQGVQRFPAGRADQAGLCRRYQHAQGKPQELHRADDESLINRGSRIRDSVKSDGDSASILSSATDEDCASVTLDPLEHEWMLCASDGLWESLQPLLAVEPGLVAKRDFVTGFTCLHWAAKQGKAQLLGQLLAFCKESAVPVNVNVRSGAGYTPLHLAAMHGHTQAVRVLLSDWEADPDARDYSGRRAVQYLPPALAADLRELGAVTSPGAESDNENANRSGGGAGRGWRFLQANLNPLRLLNLPAGAVEEGAVTARTKGGMQRKSSLSRLNARLHRGRHRAQIIHSASFRDTGEMGRGEELPSSPLRTRPLSNLFG